MLVFAHRGLHNRHVSENTLAAFGRAVETGADGIEFDLRVSRDGVRDLTAEELQAVALRGEGRIPTLNDITSAVPPPVMFDMEIKDRDVLDPLITKLQTSAGLRERTIVSSFVLDDLLKVMEAVPGIRTALLFRRWPLPLRGRAVWGHLGTQGIWAFGFRAAGLNRRRVRSLQRRGWKVAAWDEQPLKKEARKIMKLGVDIAIVFKADKPSSASRNDGRVVLP